MLRWRADWLKKQMTGKLLVRANERDFEASRQALLKRYVTFEFTPEVASTNWSVFLNDVKQHSGRHKHQGGLVLFVIEGNGSTDIDNTRYKWKRGDLITCRSVRAGSSINTSMTTQEAIAAGWRSITNRLKIGCVTR
jgi:mannose-6-phosphate isomerase class I